jgi:hypothetical protein
MTYNNLIAIIALLLTNDIDLTQVPFDLFMELLENSADSLSEVPVGYEPTSESGGLAAIFGLLVATLLGVAHQKRKS